MTPQRFASRVRQDLHARRWLRWHCTLIGTLTLLAGWACSHALMRAGNEALWLRYGLSFLAAYAVLMLLLYAWAQWLLSRDEGDGTFDLPTPGGGRGGGADGPSFSSGGGGDFGGAGGGASFDAAAGSATESSAQGLGGALEIAGAADEGIVVLVPLALLIGIALALGAVLGFAVFGLFGVELLLAVAVEIALASVGGALAYKAQAEGWLAVALRRTAMPAALVLAALVALGAAIDVALPQAKSLPQAIRLLRV